MRTIKRYRNRKLYDTLDSRYITLVGLGELLHNGEDIRVIDAKTQQDITGTVLTQVLLREQRSQNMPMALTRIRELLRTGEEILHSSVQKISSEAEKTVQRPISEVRQFLDSTIGAFDEFQSLVDERMDSVLAAIKQLSPIQRDYKAMQEKIDALEKRIEKLENMAGKPTSGGKK